jgi:hypothetical protein
MENDVEALALMTNMDMGVLYVFFWIRFWGGGGEE